MARINKSDVIQKAVSDLGISVSTDKIPTETLDKVQLTYDLNRRNSQWITNTTRSTTGTGALTFPTVDSRSDNYLTAITFGMIKDSTCDIATGQFQLLVTDASTGIAKSILGIPIITLTAQNQVVTLTFPYPIKLKNNVNGNFTMTFSVGVMSMFASAIGYTASSN